MTAIISSCGQYRYRLERTVAMAGPVYAFFGINPSTADASENDQTVRKWIGFTKTWGGSRFIVGNVFAFRSKDVSVLAHTNEVVGRDNFTHVEQIAADADVLVPCWGSRAKVPRTLWHHIDTMSKFLRAQGKPVMAFGVTASGDPAHPLWLSYDTPLQPLPVEMKGMA